MTATGPLRVGSFRVRLEGREIETPDGAVRRIGTKAADVLHLLIRARGQVVAREALIEEVWKETFVSDEALTSVIYELRRAFDDDARTSGVIETIRKAGFRLVAPVREPETAPRPEATPGSPSDDPARSVGPGFRPRSVLWAALVLLAIGALVVATWTRPGTPDLEDGVRPQSQPIRSVAVLPSGLVRPPEEAALVDALTEMLTTELAQVCSADVVPGIVVREREEPWALEETRDELGVDAVVEGSILRSGDRLWISVQLVDSRSGRLLWADSWEGPAAEEGALLREVALKAAVSVEQAIPGSG